MAITRSNKKKMKTVETSLPICDISEPKQASLTPTEKSPGNKLCEHELLVIFSNSCLTTQDLFNFRQINRSWRDAATSVLLQRNVSQIAVIESKSLEPSILQDGANPKIVFRNDRGISNKKKALTQELTSLISTSLKFPASTLHMKLCENSSQDKYIPSVFKESLDFLKSDGELFKTLRLEGRMSKEKFLSIFNIICPYTPNLECLDLERIHLGPFEDAGSLKLARKIVPTQIKTLRLSSQLNLAERKNKNFMPLLLHSSPALASIKNVDQENFWAITSQGKGALIRDYKILCDLRPEQFPDLKQFLRDKIETKKGMSTLTVDVSARIYDSSALPFLNNFIKVFCASLKHFTVVVDPMDVSNTVHLPPMPNLKSLVLTQSDLGHADVDEDQLDEFGAYLHGFTKYELSVGKYFPRLKNVKLAVCRSDIYRTLFKFFNLEERVAEAEVVASVVAVAKKDCCLQSVDLLEISESVWPKISDAISMSKLFPNVKVLKIEYKEVHGLRNTIWRLCPLAECIEIYEVYHNSEVENVESVDEFFTGFSSELCAKLHTQKTDLFVSGSECMNSKRITPSVCDLQRLKQLKIKFQHILGQFGSHVSGIHAFQKMPQTKVLFSLQPFRKGQQISWSEMVSITKYYQTCLDSLSPYVQLVYEN